MTPLSDNRLKVQKLQTDFPLSPAALLDYQDVMLVKLLPQKLDAISKMPGPKGDKGGRGWLHAAEKRGLL